MKAGRRYLNYDDYKLDNPYHQEDDREPDYDMIRELQRDREDMERIEEEQSKKDSDEELPTND